ncbi:MAG: hypothetical protein PUF71_08470 [Firmicutes bacterium]|nr:hypothetical protein [Bacillota bacterium]
MKKQLSRKTLRILIPVFVLLLLILFYPALHSAYRDRYPAIDLCRGGGGGMEFILLVVGSEHMSPDLQAKALEIWAWNDAVINELNDLRQNGACSITVSGEVSRGKTTLRYEGYVTDSEGQSVAYREEKTFDFVLDPKPFQNRSFFEQQYL